MREWCSVLMIALVTLGCDAGPGPLASDAAVPDTATEVFPPLDVGVDAIPTSPTGTIRRGLVLRSQVEHPTPGPHLVELAPHGDVFYVANSNDVLAAYLIESDGGLLTTFMRPPPSELFRRCTTLSVHAPSNTLFCSHDDAQNVIAFDISDPQRPVVRDDEALTVPYLYARDIAVIGDYLYISRFERGLWVSAIDPDGNLGEPVDTTVSGNIRFVDGGEPLVAVSSDRGLLVLSGSGPTVRVASELPLDGPPQDVRLVGDRAVVALGSAGALIVDISSAPPRVVQTVRPPAVATAADLWGDALAVMTLTGAYLYDLRETPARLAGFAPAGREIGRDHGVMLHGRFVDGELLVSDWVFLERYSVDLDGDVLDLDHPRGVYLAPGAGAVVPFRNDGPHPLDVSLNVSGELFEATVPPGETVHVTIDAARLEALTPRREEGAREAYPVTTSSDVPDLRAVSTVSFLYRADAPTTHHPAPGDLLPTVAMADGESAIFHLPMGIGRQRLVFFSTDCAAMWTALEDAAYLSRRGELDDGAELHLISQTDIGLSRFDVRWGLSGVRYGHHDAHAPPSVAEENGTGFLYEERFKLRELPGAASFPTDYVVGEDGMVELVETYYRGAHPFR